MAKKMASDKKLGSTPAVQKAKATIVRELGSINKPFTKTEILTEIATRMTLSKKSVAELLQCLQDIIADHVKKALSFSIPGLLKVYVVNKPATKTRKGVNPFTGEPAIFKAKPAHKVVKIKPLKKLKAMVETSVKLKAIQGAQSHDED